VAKGEAEMVLELSDRTSHYGVIFDGPSNDHNGIMQRSLSLLKELLSASSHDECAGLSFRATFEQIESTIEEVKEMVITDEVYEIDNQSSRTTS